MMNIVCATDDNYVQHCGVMLTSLFENNKGEEIHVYVLAEKLKDSCKNSIKNIILKYDAYFHYCEIDKNLFKKCPVRDGDHVNIATYYRLILSSVLPKQLMKALYLDCDIIVRKSLRELFSLKLDNVALGAVDELSTCCSDCFIRLQFNPSFGYFNAGVLLVNLEYWRENNVEEQLFDYIAAHSDKIIFHDQDTLNAVLHNQWISISPTWNMLESFYRTGTEVNNKQVNSLLKDPAILHYSWRRKPWNVTCMHPLKGDYFKYLALTEWRHFHCRKELIPWGKMVVRKILSGLKIMAPLYKSI